MVTTTWQPGASARLRSASWKVSVSPAAMVKSSSSWSTTSSSRALVAWRASSRVAAPTGWPGRPSSAAPSSSSGASPGRMTRVTHSPGPNSRLRLSAGIKPACTSDDLPLPDGPITAMKRSSRSRWSSSSCSGSRPTNWSCWSSRNGAMPGYGQEGTSAAAGTGRRSSAHSRSTAGAHSSGVRASRRLRTASRSGSSTGSRSSGITGHVEVSNP
jgi:hypothetical protein